MQHLEVSGAVRHIYIYIIGRLKVNPVPLRLLVCISQPEAPVTVEQCHLAATVTVPYPRECS